MDRRMNERLKAYLKTVAKPYDLNMCKKAAGICTLQLFKCRFAVDLRATKIRICCTGEECNFKYLADGEDNNESKGKE